MPDYSSKKSWQENYYTYNADSSYTFSTKCNLTSILLKSFSYLISHLFFRLEAAQTEQPVKPITSCKGVLQLAHAGEGAKCKPKLPNGTSMVTFQFGSLSLNQACYLHLTSRWPWLFQFKCAALL